MKKIAILGSTGSIGKQTLDVIRNLGKEEFKVVSLAAKSDWETLYKQSLEFDPEIIALYDRKAAFELRKILPNKEILEGEEGVLLASSWASSELVVSAISGTLGLKPTIKAIEAGKDIALANKEALVSGGKFILELAKKKGANLLPVDSEHSAIFQCLKGNAKNEVSRLIITASGGPFKNRSYDELDSISYNEALKHPTWQMGPKITIDCSTLMNKGLEVIEAHFLFDIPVEKIEVVIHPESVIHSLVEFIDGSMMAQMSRPTMFVPIQYALTHPERKKGLLEPFNFELFSSLHFQKPDFNRFVCLKLAFDALKIGKSMPCFMNAANEVLVERFSKNQVSWLEIGNKLNKLMDAYEPIAIHSLDDIIEVDNEAKRIALTY
ncbi:1-deoxy-D-xylulose-5-phosphate reductoisomerase [Criblamydia sequanensis]|uniref:1-deoxy-D-xylulose 5-phosphate reductoisomerase n=1 Tax=Candidatus Criblamydia sequanensis CRIB-18 TaxID=1437425 RepID=A0A090D2M5_9BACT|nr:1-deoxy-D-xylulose-5-phosphate reductoisomerase [Criblamydia sequanensis]CDR34740.1 1-deoxy-D-xylulose 5-phosphate reductoisomerase [Criblamydia sequanensis CRIB-18]